MDPYGCFRTWFMSQNHSKNMGSLLKIQMLKFHQISMIWGIPIGNLHILPSSHNGFLHLSHLLLLVDVIRHGFGIGDLLRVAARPVVTLSHSCNYMITEIRIIMDIWMVIINGNYGW